MFAKRRLLIIGIFRPDHLAAVRQLYGPFSHSDSRSAASQRPLTRTLCRASAATAARISSSAPIVRHS
eukprot:751767-Pleurochrysis_carterae.AAC.1